METQAGIYLHARRASSASDDVLTSNNPSVVLCGVGFRSSDAIEDSHASPHGVTQHLLKVVFQTLEDGAEINYRGKEARVGLYMGIKNARVAEEASESSDAKTTEQEKRGHHDGMLSVAQHFGLDGPR